MGYTFSAATNRMKSSKIRELMKYAAMPGVISFGGGSPDPEHFPFTEVKEIINRWDDKTGHTAMQYGTTTGYTPLVEAIKKRMTDVKKMSLEGQDIVVTTGGQQGLFLLSRIFIDRDDVVLVEDPTFIGAMASFLSCEASLECVATDEKGVNIDELEHKIIEIRKSGRKIAFFYTIPNFQNPGGSAMPQERRKALYELSLKYNLVILEDDPYGDLYYTGEHADYLPVKSYGNEAPIIYAGSFSKVLSPGFRLGWLFGDKEVIEKAGLAKQSIDACSTTFGQVIASDYLNSGKIDDYLSLMRRIYREKRDIMVESINAHFPETAQYAIPSGGFFIYIRLPESISAAALFSETIKENVAFVTGEPFHVDPIIGDKHIRLSFSNSSPEEIKNGIEVIGRCMKKLV